MNRFEWRVLCSGVLKELNTENSRFLLSKIPVDSLIDCWANICHYTRLTPQLMQRVLKAGISMDRMISSNTYRIKLEGYGSFRFQPEFNRTVPRGSLIFLLVANKQPYDIIKMALEAGAAVSDRDIQAARDHKVKKLLRTYMKKQEGGNEPKFIKRSR